MSQHSSRGAAWAALRKRILDRDGWLCGYCGKHLEGRDATVDHITPKDAGGTDEDFNLVASCLACNIQKGNKVVNRTTWFNREYLEGVA